MNKRQYIFALVLMVASGFLGGLASNKILASKIFNPSLAQAAAEKVIRAHRFELVDASDKLRGEFGFIKGDDPGITLLGEGGEVTAKLVSLPDTPMLFLTDRSAKSYIQMLALDKGPTIFVSGGKGKPHVQIHDAGISLKNETGILRASLGLSPTDNAPGLWLADRSGKAVAAFGVDVSGPSIELADENLKKRVALHILENGWPRLTFYDSQTNPVLHVPETKIFVPGDPNPH